MWKIMKENLEDLLSPNLWRSLACETVGTLVIVLLGCGAWVGGPHNEVVVALAFGLGVATMLWCFAHISGGHFNPALTAATLVTRRVSIVRGVLYIIAQVVGGIIGAGILYGLTPAGMRRDLGVTFITEVKVAPNVTVDPNVTEAQGFGVEMLITFVFVLAYFASKDSVRSDLAGSYPLTVGLAVVVCHLFAVKYTMAGMNCARSFGPAVIMQKWDNHWVYWVGPLTGGIVAGLLYEYVFSAGATVTKASKCLRRIKRPSNPAPEKAPLEASAEHEVIEIDEKLAVEDDKEATPANATDTSSDKAKLTDDNAVKE